MWHFHVRRCRTLNAADATSLQEGFKVLSIHEPSLRGCKAVFLPALLLEDPSPKPGAERWCKRRGKSIRCKLNGFFFLPQYQLINPFDVWTKLFHSQMQVKSSFVPIQSLPWAVPPLGTITAPLMQLILFSHHFYNSESVSPRHSSPAGFRPDPAWSDSQSQRKYHFTTEKKQFLWFRCCSHQQLCQELQFLHRK